MATEIRVPKLGMVQSDITVIELSRSDGDAVDKDEKVAVIETAKVSYDIYAPAEGRIFYLKRVKDKVASGDLLGVVAESREAFERFTAGLAPEEKKAPEAAPAGAPEPEEDAWGVTLSFEEEGPAEAKAPARPAPAPSPALPQVDLEGRKILERIPFLGMRRAIADNLVASLQTGAQLTIVSKTDMTGLEAFRKELVLDYPDTKITYVDMLVKILAFALRDYPIVNATLVGDEIVVWDEVHMGVAVALEDGLVVPVVRNADRKGLGAVSREIKRLSRKARQNELGPDDYQGGTFTLTSGGKVETDIITPIINPPQSAILAVGRIAPQPAVHQGELCIRTLTHLCLTHDHRIIDGVPASLFLGRVKEIIESPELFRKVLR
ncbi:MAG: 2-oxo acid dehydrogenase subunit E2 [Deltaproteobacteria bacterium]|nr:2-oxo acid dehydrogenase subunit E2 [Deltaproteobacteria bacterium]